MHSYSKKLIARFLLFIFLLESCYNPNIDIGRKELLASKDPANKQSQYEEELYDKYPPSANKSHFYDSRQAPHNATSPNEQGQGEAKEYSTQSKQKGISPQQAQEQQVRQGLLPLPSPVQEIGKDPRGQDQPRAIPAHSTSKRLSITSSESPRQRVATKQAISVQQITRRTTSLEEQKKLEHSQQAARAKRLEDIASRVFLAQGGQQVCFMHQDGQWQARIMERIGEFYRSEELPVVCQGHGDVQEALKALQAQDKLLHKYWVHVLPATHAHPTMVYLGRLGLLGGGNSQSSSSRSIALTPLCDVCGQPTTYMSSHRGVGYQCPDLDCTGKPTEPRQSSPQLSSSQPARTFHTATFQYAEKAQKISRYLERNSTVTSASEARHVAWRLDDYLRDLRGLSSQARSLDFAAYSRQLSQLDGDLVRELEQIRQEAEDKAIETRHIEDANLQINDYNKELSKLYEFIEGTRCIESVSQVKKIKDQLQSSIEKLHQLVGYIGLFLGNVSNVKRSEFEDRHQKRIDALQKLDQKLAVSVRQIARSQQLEAELTRYQDRSQQIQDEFGKRFAIESPEHAAALRSQLQGHITYLNEVWSSMKSIGFDTADDREQAHENHQIHIASLEQLCSDIQQGAQALTKAEQVKEALLCYEGMMQTIDEEFSGAIRVESVEQAQQMQSSLQSHRDALLALWAEVASLTADAPVEDLAQFHTGYLEGLQRFYEELEEIAQKLAYTQRVGAEVDRYETRMAAIREEVRTTTVIDRVEQAQQIKARLQEHIAYVRELWASIEALREAAPEASLRQFHASNLGMLQELAVQVEESEHRLSHTARVQAEVDRYQERMQAIQSAFGEGIRITSPAQGQQLQAQLQEDLSYVLGVWESIKEVSDGNPEEQLCQLHKANVDKVQELHDDIAKSVSAMESQEHEQRQVARYQEVLDAVNQAFGSSLSISSAEQASEMAKSLQKHINSLASLGPIVTDHQERLAQLGDLHQSLEQQARSLAFDAMVTQQCQHVAAAFSSINQLLQDGETDPEQVIAESSSLRDELRTYQAALVAYSTLEQQAAQLAYLRANEEHVTQLLDSYAQQHGAKQRDDQVGVSSAINQQKAQRQEEQRRQQGQRPREHEATDVSQAGLESIARHEGCSLTVYKDIAGLETIGYGHLIKSGEDFSNGITHEAALELLRQDAKKAEDAVNSYVTVSLSQNQFDALVSFTFNVGSGALRGSTLLRLINSGNTEGIRDAFLMWNKAKVGGVLRPVEGLTIRRDREANLFLDGTY